MTGTILMHSEKGAKVIRIETARKDVETETAQKGTAAVQKGADLTAILRQAALEYCRTTEEGRKIFWEKGCLRYEDFFAEVPEEILEKRGILAMQCDMPDMEVSGADALLDSADAVFLTEYPSGSGCGQKQRDICYTAVRLGEMWGIVETLDGNGDFMQCMTEEKVKRLIDWAEEYAAVGGDLPEFFRKKLEGVLQE